MVTDLRSDIVWSSLEGNFVTVSEVTYGALTVSADDVVIWGEPEFNLVLVKLIEWLSHNWVTLDRERVVGCSRNEIEANLPEEDFKLFLHNHNLSQAFTSQVIPELLVWRDDTNGYVETGAGVFVFPVAVWRKFFLHLGHEVAQQLMYATDKHSQLALYTWALHSVTM